MKKCKVAILDSGLFQGCYNNMDVKNADSKNYDDNGHGTMCYEIIRKIAPNTDFYIKKILNLNLEGSSKILLNTLTDLLDTDINIINLSLSTEGNEYKEKLNNVCEQLYYQSKIIIASKNNGKKNYSYPCMFQNVIGVSGEIFEKNVNYKYDLKSKIQAEANKVPFLVKGLDQKYHFFGGNSKATACMTGIVASYWKYIKDMKNYEREVFLASKVEESFQKSNNNESNMDKYSEIMKFIATEVEPIITSPFRCLNEELACEVLCRFQNEFSVIIRKEEVSIMEFNDMHRLGMFFLRALNEEKIINGKEYIKNSGFSN